MLVLNFMLSLMTSLRLFLVWGGTDMVVNAICNQWFKSNFDIHVKDEFSVDRESIYSLPPLDEVTRALR